ncbi:MAG: hypothetical protein E2P02_00275 [Acidobacteria bacterium]|nr:MAG: hypothetical protein E2P02_00275 [Acidobacteriota bacterium]
MTKSPTPLRKIVPELSPQVERIVQRALAKDSVERYQSAEEFAAALSGARDTQESERAEASTILRSLPAGATRRRLRAVVAAAATFVAAGFLLRALLAPPEPAFEPEPTRVVAVLGFENLTGEEALGHVGRGAAHTLASNLATINGFTTISHSIALDITESTDLRAAARDLGVGLFVTGSMLKAGDKLKFIVEVLRADGTIAWGGEFEGSASDLFDIQRRLSEGVVAGLDVDLTRKRRAGWPRRRHVIQMPTPNTLKRERFSSGTT